MKATGIVRRIDDLGRVVIPKEIRRTMRIREGDPLQTTLTNEMEFCLALLRVADRLYIRLTNRIFFVISNNIDCFASEHLQG